MASSGDSNDSQNNQSTQDGENAELPTVAGKASVPVPDGKASQPAMSTAGSSGDSKARAPKPSAASWPPRPPHVPGDEAGKKPLEPPFDADKTLEGELLKGDYSPLGTAGAIGGMVAVVAKDTAVAAAKMLHPDDPVAAALATTEALTAVLRTTIGRTTVLSGGRDSATSTPHSERLAQEAVLAGIIGDRGDLSKWEKEKSSVYKNAKLLPTFPGSICKTQPDVWEEWWEKSLR